MKKESKTIRSFLAIDLAEDLKPEIADVQKEFKKTGANIKYVPSQNMHFTLKFFGNIDENMVEEISEAVEKVIRNYSAFDLSIGGCGSFPNQNTIKVLWIGIDRNSQIADLQKDLDMEFKKLGFKKERNYISQPRNGKNKKQMKDTINSLKDLKIGTMTVSKISLKKSTLTPQGPIYEDIKVFNLD